MSSEPWRRQDGGAALHLDQLFPYQKNSLAPISTVRLPPALVMRPTDPVFVMSDAGFQM